MIEPRQTLTKQGTEIPKIYCVYIPLYMIYVRKNGVTVFLAMLEMYKIYI